MQVFRYTVEEMASFRTPNEPLPPAELIAELSDGTKVKRRGPRMRACSEKNEKGKLCAGHLKRWFTAPPEIISGYGDELYRCEKCRTIYLPYPGEDRSPTVGW